MNVMPSSPLTISEAIAREEGWYAQNPEPTRCQRNNNPGNLEYGLFTRLHGATGTDGRFAVFSSGEQGVACLIALLNSAAYVNHTIATAIAEFAPSSENNTISYVQNVCTWMEAEPDTILSTIQSLL